MNRYIMLFLLFAGITTATQAQKNKKQTNRAAAATENTEWKAGKGDTVNPKPFKTGKGKGNATSRQVNNNATTGSRKTWNTKKTESNNLRRESQDSLKVKQVQPGAGRATENRF